MNISKVICGNYSYQLYSFNYFLESMKRLEQKEIELWGAGPHLFQDDFSEQMIHSLYKKIKSYGLRVICYTPEQCMYPINIASSDPIIRKRSMAYLTRSLEIASQMEAPKALITTGQGYRDESKEDAWNRCVEALSILGGKAEQLGVTIVFEHLTKTTTNLCLKARDVDRMLKEVGMKNVVGMIDVDMAARLHEGVRDYFELMGKSIQHVHFVDGNPGGHLAIGDGILPMDSYISDLNSYDYDGYLTMEILHDSYHLDPEAAYAKSLEWCRNHQYLFSR